MARQIGLPLPQDDLIERPVGAGSASIPAREVRECMRGAQQPRISAAGGLSSLICVVEAKGW